MSRKDETRLKASPKIDVINNNGRRKGLPKKGNPLTQKRRQGLAPRRLEASPKKALELIPAPGDNVILELREELNSSFRLSAPKNTIPCGRGGMRIPGASIAPGENNMLTI
ncbi:hypothetical protein BY996DRAFT_6471098 [Phakopsora pachyrhizi]|nr:hypothetical protein BY996DRAFT_6471098 [Phakopsora pachyrhizi]